jgi:hypothetical protein
MGALNPSFALLCRLFGWGSITDVDANSLHFFGTTVYALSLAA